MDQYNCSIARIECTHRRIHWNMPFESTRTEVSRGTGFFIDIGSQTPIRDEEGNVGRYLITCAHVINNNEPGSLRVVLANDLDRRYNAVTVQTCPEVDIAVIIAFLPVTFAIKFLTIGNSDTLETNPDNSVTAVGFPLGGGIKVSRGVFSGFARGKGIQHTSPISPGSSGCPLLNSDQKIVGINYQGEIAATVSNIHYAVSINLAMVIIHDATLRKKKLYRVPRLGVCFHNTSRAMLRHIQRRADKPVEGVIIYRIEQECVQNLLKHNPNHRALILRHLGDGTRSMDGKENDTLSSQSFFLTNIAWKGDSPGSERYKAAIQGLLMRDNSHVDMNGLVEVAWTKQKIPLEALLGRIPESFRISLGGWFNPIGGQPKPVVLECTKSFNNKGVLKKLHYPYFDSPVHCLQDTYFCFMGMCVVLLHYNHYAYLQEIMCIPRHGRRKLRFVVVKVFDQSELADSRIIRMGDELESLVSEDGEIPIRCKNIPELKRLICKLIRKHGKIGIKNKSNRWFHMESEDMLRQEQLMQQRSVYVPDADLMRALQDSMLRVGAQRIGAPVYPPNDEPPKQEPSREPSREPSQEPSEEASAEDLVSKFDTEQTLPKSKLRMDNPKSKKQRTRLSIPMTEANVSAKTVTSDSSLVSAGTHNPSNDL